MTTRKMWDVVRKRVEDEVSSSKAPPLSIMDFTSKYYFDKRAMPYAGEKGSEALFPSKQTLRTMPSYLGVYEPNLVVLRVPSIWNARWKNCDTRNLHVLMSALVTCTLPLKVRDLSYGNMLQDV